MRKNVSAQVSDVADAIRTVVEAPAAAAAATATAPASLKNGSLEVMGFYKVTGSEEATFYATSNNATSSDVGAGWTVIGLTGIAGQVRIAGADTKRPGTAIIGPGQSETYLWSFTFQSDTNQSLQGVTHVIAATLYPPEKRTYVSKQVSVDVRGSYIVYENTPRFKFDKAPPQGMGAGWTMTGLPTVPVELEVTSYDSIRKEAWLKTVDGSILPSAAKRVYLGLDVAPATLRASNYTSKFVPGKFTNTVVGAEASMLHGTLDPTIMGGNPAPLRDLDSGIPWDPPPVADYTEIRDRGFSTGAVLSLFAIGPQEEYLLSKDLSTSNFNPKFKQHTNFVMYHRVIPFPIPSPTYQGSTVQLEIRPAEIGHLLSNMYFKCTLPRTPYPPFANYTDGIGRALIKQVDLLVNETVVETLYDDWYIIRDQLFLDANEQAAMREAIGGTRNSETQFDVVVPLEFFFCRRHSHGNKNRERLARPYFPVCAMLNQKIYIRFTFHPSTWWSSDTRAVNDFVNPCLITEEILLDNKEKLYYQNTPLNYVVNRVKKESTLAFTNNNPRLQLTASFPVQAIMWFFRNKNYEDPTNSVFYDSRYSYGYTTKYIKTGIQLDFPSGSTSYVDVIDTAKITLNNVDILSTFQGSLYYTFKQPMEHGFSVPSKSIYMHSFGLTPTEYNQGGFLNFSKLNSSTTALSLNFATAYAAQVIQGYNLYLFYYGYTLLEFQNGFARLPFL